MVDDVASQFKSLPGFSSGSTSSDGQQPSGGKTDVASQFDYLHGFGPKPERIKQQEQENDPGYLADTAKGLGAGLVRGTASLAGLPGDVAAAARWTAEHGKYYGLKAGESVGLADRGAAEDYWNRIEQEKKAPDRNMVGGILPTSEKMTQLAEKYVPLGDYHAKTVPGRLVESAAEFIPAALTPVGEASLGARLATGAASGIGSELAGMATSGTAVEPLARIAGALAGPGAASRLAGPIEQLLPQTVKSAMDVAPAEEAAASKLASSMGQGLTPEQIQTIRDYEQRTGITPEQSHLLASDVYGGLPSDIMSKAIDRTAMLAKDNPDRARAIIEEHNNRATRVPSLFQNMVQEITEPQALESVNKYLVSKGKDPLSSNIGVQDLQNLAEDLQKERANEMFKDAFNDKGVWNRKLENIFYSPAGQRIARAAEDNYLTQVAIKENKIAPDRILKPAEEWQNLPSGSVSPVAPREMPMEFWHEFSQLMGNTDTKSWSGGLRNTFDSGIQDYYTKRNAPNRYRAAQEDFKKGFGEQDAITAGAKFLNDAAKFQSDPRKREAFLNNWKNANDAEKALFNYAFNKNIGYAAEQEGGLNAINKMFRDPQNKELFEKVLNWSPNESKKAGQTSFDKFSNALDIANAMKKSDSANFLQKNSGLAEKVVDKFYRTPFGTVVTNAGVPELAMQALANVGLFGTPFGVATALGGAYGYARQVARNREAAQMLNVLETRDPAQIQQLAQQIASSPKSQSNWKLAQKALDYTDAKTQEMYRRAVAGYTGASARIEEQKQMRGFAIGGGIHMQDGGSLTGERKLDPRGTYSEGAEIARKILPQAQGSGPEFIQRLLNKGVRADELHHTRIEGQPLRDMNTGVLHPSVQGQIGGHELANLIQNNAPQIKQILRGQNPYKYDDYPSYDYSGQKLPYGSNYVELNNSVNKGPTEFFSTFINDLLAPPSKKLSFTPPENELTVLPEWGAGLEIRKEAPKRHLRRFMPFDENHPEVRELANSRDPVRRVFDRFGNFLHEGRYPQLAGSNLPYEEINNQFRTLAHNDVRKNTFKKVLNLNNQKQAHFSDVPNMPYHARMQDLPVNGMKNLNIEEGQSDAARKFDDRKRYGDTPVIRYNAKEHEALYKAASAAQNKLLDPHISDDEEEAAKNTINNYIQFHHDVHSGVTAPDIPFIENNKAWQRALAKNLLHHAAKNGYESISFTPWQEQVARAAHGKPMQMLHISDHPVDPGFRVVGIDSAHDRHELPVGVSMDDLKKIYGDEIVGRLREAPFDASGKVRTLKDDSYAKKPFYAFLPQHGDVDREDHDSRENFVTEAIDNGKALRRKAEVHNAFIKQFQNVINEEHDPKFKLNYAHHTAVDYEGNPLVLPGAVLPPELRDSILKKGFKRFKEGGYVKNHLTQPIDPQKKYAFGGAPNERRIVNKSVVMPKPGDPDFVGPTMSSSSYDPNKSHVFDKLNVMHRDNPLWTPDLGNVSARGYKVDKTGRSIMRSTGGRIPEADKLFKQAKKYVDSHTKQLLNVHDDDIVKALRVAAKRV
jgi:hypothetical protein